MPIVNTDGYWFHSIATPVQSTVEPQLSTSDLMGDAEVFGKLSRIFETHGFGTDDSALDDILEDFDPSEVYGQGETYRVSPSKTRSGQLGSTGKSNPYSERPSPYEVWREKNKDKFTKKKHVAKLNGQQWDTLVDKMHQSNRVKQSTMIKEQNQGLAAELEGFSFKPRINKTSMELSSTMKSLTSRIKEMQEEREKDMDAKRKAAERQEIAECSFAPKRNGAKISDTLLKKLGREKLTPEDLFRYEQEKERRNEIRKQIVDEVEERELTFRPRLGERSLRLQEKLVQRGVIEVDPLTRTAVPPTAVAYSQAGDQTVQTVLLSPSTSKRRHNNPLGVSLGLGLASTSGEEVQFEEGPLLQIESEHPYRHNTNEYTTVQVPGAVSYCVRFSEDTHTEPIYDFVKFYDNETHTEYFGAGKYSGGTNGTSCNWPGVGGRPPLVIPASKFIIHFKTNGTVNDWGFRMLITPTLSSHMRRQQLANAGIPMITDTGRLYQSPSSPAAGAMGRARAAMGSSGSLATGTPGKPVPVHLRLYQGAVERATEQHNAQIDLMQNKLNIPLKPWENVRSADARGGAAHKFIRMNSSTHLPKHTLSAVADSLVVNASFTAADGNGATPLLLPQPPAAGAPASASVGGGSVFSAAPGTAALPPTVVEFDDSLAALWKQLRTTV